MFTTFKSGKKAFKDLSFRLSGAQGFANSKEDKKEKTEILKFWFTFVISVFILCASFYIILTKQFDDGIQKLASGLIGSVGGFWLK